MASSNQKNDFEETFLEDRKALETLLKQLQQAPKHGQETRILSEEQAKLLANRIKKLLQQHLN